LNNELIIDNRQLVNKIRLEQVMSTFSMKEMTKQNIYWLVFNRQIIFHYVEMKWRRELDLRNRFVLCNSYRWPQNCEICNYRLGQL